MSRQEKPELPEYEEITVEKLHELYKSEDLFRPSYQLYRLNLLHGRIYFRLNGDGKTYTLYLGTSSLSSLLPMERPLLKSIVYRGLDESEEFMRQRAVYGSYMHRKIAEYFSLGYIDHGDIPVQLKEEMGKHNIPMELYSRWTEEMKCDLSCFCQWVVDYEIRPLMIEMPLCSDLDHTATMIDFVGFANKYNYTTLPRIAVPKYTKRARKERAEFDIKVGDEFWQWETIEFTKYSKVQPSEDDLTQKREQQLVIVDFKSGKKGFWESNRLQLAACRQLLIENFPLFAETNIELYNWSPKDFTGISPTYNYQCQTNKVDDDDYRDLINRGKRKLTKWIIKPVRLIEGRIDMGQDPSGCIFQKSIESLIQEHYWKDFLVEEDDDTAEPEQALIMPQ
jgi:hypothetical protein